MNGRLRVASAGVVCTLAVVLTSAWRSAQAIPNWPAPATWAPAGGMVASAQADLSRPLPFIPITPCRVADTRGNGFTGEYGPPALMPSGSRNFTIAGQCGIPASSVGAVSFNFTVVGGTAAGDLRFYPAGSSLPLVSTINWTAGQSALANAAVVPLGTGGAISVQNDSTGTVQLIIDVNGYYTQYTNSGQWFGIIASEGGGIIYGENTSTGGGNVSGVRGTVPNGGAGASGVLGEYAGTSAGYGVEGTSVAADNATGVVGRDQSSTPTAFAGRTYSSAGVRGESASGIGVLGLSTHLAGHFENFNSGGSQQSVAQLATPAYGVIGLTTSTAGGAAGAVGIAGETTGETNGVYGYTYSVSADAAAVEGIVGFPNLGTNHWVYAGVRGEGGPNSIGVAGISNNIGVGGYHLNSSTGTIETAGYLGESATTAIFGSGNSVVTGTKSFVDPHPTDPTKVIKYVSLEGPEAGTYFRGRGRFEGRTATIEFPESFRMVTDEKGLSIQVTPIGGFASVYIEYIGLDQVVVRSTKDVEFFFTVNGVRKAFKDFQPIQENEEYRPMTATDTMPTALSAEQKRVLIQTGIYNEDGTVNMDTAERLGWVQQWREQEVRLKAAAETAAAKRIANPMTVEKMRRQP